jgi:predicted RNA-binding Zn-ribbon protein involved in translation (DUF1610 family)
MSAGLLTTAESSDPFFCPYCHRQLRWAATRRLAHGIFECERCGEFPDFRILPREPLPGDRPPTFDSPLILSSSKDGRLAQDTPAPSAE